ncbi:MAG: hypothetical protein WD872_02485 [Pirellulaceae bacterium]
MTTLEFEGSLGPNGTLRVPDEVASQLRSVDSFRVVVVVPGEDDDDQAWRRLGIEQFLKDGAPGDAIYDDL